MTRLRWLGLGLVVACTIAATAGGPSVRFRDDGVLINFQPFVNFAVGITCTEDAPSSEIDCEADIFSAPANLYVAGHNSLAEFVNIADQYVGTGTQAALQSWGTHAWITPLGSGMGTHLSCDGVNDYVSAADHADFSPSGSVSFVVWSRPHATDEQEVALGTTPQIMFSKRTTTTYPFSLYVTQGARSDDGKVGVLFFGNNGATSVASTDGITNFGDPTTGRGTMVVVTIEELGAGSVDAAKIYFGNTLDTTATVNWSMLDTTGTFKLCADENDAGTAGSFFPGRIDGFRLYAGLLAQADIDTLYNAGAGVSCSSGLQTGLNVCYDFSETSGTTLEDDGPLGTDQDGTLNGFSSPPSATSGWAFCPSGACLHLDGTDDYLTVRDIADLDFTTTDTLTYEHSFVNADAAIVTADRTLSSKGTRSTGNTNYTIDIASGTDEVRFSYGNSSCSGIADTWTSTTFNLSAGAVEGVAIVYTFGTGSTFEMYKLSGGTATAVTGAWATNGNAAPCVNTLPLQSGSASAVSSVGPWKGRVDNVQIWRADHGTTGQVESDMNTTCTATGTGKEACWPMDDGAGNLVAQLADQSNLGNDANTCTSTSTPCRTISAAVAKWPQLFNATAVTTIAPGVYPEEVIMRGFRPAAAATIALRGRFGQPNTFGADTARISSSTTGSNTRNFPQDTKSLFNDTANPFTTAMAVDEAWLEITTGTATTGYCLGTGFDSRNWYPIEQRQSDSQVAVVTHWSECGMPQVGTYKIYSPDEGVTLHAGKQRQHAISVLDSAGVMLQKVKLTGALDSNLRVLNSTMDEISVVVLDDSEYVGVQTKDAANIPRFSKWIATDSYAGVNHWSSTMGTVLDWIASRNLNGGFGAYFGAYVNGSFGPGHMENNGYAGLDVENSSQSYTLAWVRVECPAGGAGNGFIVAANSNLNAVQRFTITSGGGNCGNALTISSSSEFLTNMQGGEVIGDNQIKNSSRGSLLEKNSTCNLCAEFTYTSVTTPSCHNCVAKTLSTGDNDNVMIDYVGRGDEVYVVVSGPGAAFNLGGITGTNAKPLDGDEIWLDNITNFNMTLTHEDTGSTAAYRFTTSGTTAVTTGPGVCHARYAASRNRWVVLGCFS